MLLVLIFWRSTALPKIHFKEVTYVPYCPTNKTCETSKAFYSSFRCIHHIALDFDTDSSGFLYLFRRKIQRQIQIQIELTQEGQAITNLPRFPDWQSWVHMQVSNSCPNRSSYLVGTDMSNRQWFVAGTKLQQASLLHSNQFYCTMILNSQKARAGRGKT